MSLFTLFYNLILIITYILLIPYLLYKKRENKYKDAIPSKFFLKNNPKFDFSGIWFHSCSMGEVKAIKPLIQEFEAKANISVITNTGFEEAKTVSQNVRYLPFEIFIPFWITKQKVLVVMEAELWYMLFLCAKRKGAKTLLINARISDRSYKSYLRFKFFYKKIFENIDKVFAQSQLDKKRLEELGAKNVEVIGNIKLAQLPQKKLDLKKPNSKVIVAASTHEGEEELVLSSYKKEYGKLIVVPRHPERFLKVEELIKDYIKDKEISFHKYSLKEDFSSDIILIDKMGMLNDIYSIGDITILGGAFANVGGHNPIEPAYFGNIIISGKNIFNQKSLFECIKNYYLIEKNELKEYLEKSSTLLKPELTKEGSFEPIIKEIKKWQ
ncbi:3-deoxy-D-manno-octulosonic acid transferase [Aliarcobacter skirrowii]|uniref:3-deoxy-D-manno-octulosonic acid transferase n=1 Tax=Aliarcobacter skirrowii TaxID=28200 RepID=A0A2U2C1U4_9BACT|nr:3-deoxy-D-manno-octulosonic acid transferase [Aliarcobacter skirrowii]PWE22300.1 3-deoxy-D-manno-octulosonic acid transferase [Aliarcobacter skirrowii]PWE25980.1 3-deoxy-D-manno-octulosonic acid transferase [Aliarcobacter skirrowii]RJO56008.1 3-deoxy-D-manno-octulosonic acid transferase [Aliarcobacter skirrowii]RJO57994.1 3-deoxy-D-manno-octulosonic acid transferase [Aliarcobacter skirrowii]